MIKNVTRLDAKNNPNIIVPLASDEIFHKVFGTKENVSNTEVLISVFLGIPLKDIKGRVEIKSSDMDNLTVFSKHGEKDIVAWVDINEPLKLNIEMNRFSTSPVTIDRNTFFLADLFSSGLEYGTGYKNLVTTIQINFNPRYVDQINSPIIDKYTLKNTYNYELTNKFILYQINLAELSDIWYNKSKKDVSNIDPLVILFGALIWENEKDKFKKIVDEMLIDKDIKDSIEGIVLNMNKDTFVVRNYYDIEEARIEEWNAEIEYAKKESYKEGHESGLIEGLKEKEREIILNMYNKNIDIHTISDISNLSIKEIEKIINENTNK